jgi:predicted small lipoprotein YifL
MAVRHGRCNDRVPASRRCESDRMNTRRPRALILVASLSLAGCITVGPDYAPPQVDAPGAWQGAAAPAETGRAA